MKIVKNSVVVLFTVLLLAACSGNQMDFEFTDQDAQPFGSKELTGKVWVANFIFTNCETVCPPMTAHMAKLQQMLADEGVEAELVSFSVDPEVDSPEALKEFAEKFDADFQNWHFLTGYSQAEIEEFAKVNFQTLVQKPENNDQVMHGTSFVIVNPSGEVIESFNGVESPSYDEMVALIKKLN